MTTSFMIGDEAHAVGDLGCPACPEDYPEPCTCGGLMHAGSETDAVDEEGEMLLATRCDQCGRSVDDLGVEVA